MKLASLKYVKLVSDASGWSLRESFGRMFRARIDHKVSFAKYYKREFYLRPETTVPRKAQSIMRNADVTNVILTEICEETGLTPEEIQAEKNKFGDIYTVGLRTFLRWEIFAMTDEERVEIANKFRKNEQFRYEILSRIAVADRSKIDMAEVENIYADYKKFLEGFITERVFGRRSGEYLEVAKDGDEKSEEGVRNIVIDLEATRYVLGLSNKEYFMFRLWDKSFAEKMDYIPNSIHTGMMLYINGYDLVDICNDKYDTYTTLKPYFCRDMIMVSSKRDYKQLADFVAKHDKGVFKPLTQTKGEGVRLVDFNEELTDRSTAGIKAYIKEQLDESGMFVMEELIIAHPEFSRINPDAINTVRALVYYDGETMKIDGVLFRVGRMGSFVDNGALGGILMTVDPETGVVTKPGADQAGFFYEEHPDTGVMFVGYQIPDWDKAKNMLRQACESIGPGYIGWDITYTANEDWVIVEANGTPQQYGIQSSTGEGALPHFSNTVGCIAYEAYAHQQQLRANKCKEKADNDGDRFSKI